ncbi:MAG: glycosyltransferase family 2 protein, partial [Microbacteriaceae bacterium]|nr:glycosyltransferase family 2 protein [Microbacteriaceae bacterium]
MADAGPIVMTLMVRDEVDLVAAMIEHHLAQGVDLIIATDNGSVDGTREVLADYAALGAVELHDDPHHRKQQAEVVTRMARRAFDEHGATWVLNADADEFWFAASGATLAEALAEVPAGVVSFEAPVRNLLGRPLESGSAVRSHVWRDERDDERLREVGLHEHPTSNCVHRGDAGVEVAQGNHFTSLPLADAGEVPEAARIEVLHLPYRSWAKYRGHVETTAAAYAASGLAPSPRHHGMRDARWLEADALLPVFVARHPDEHADPAAAGFVRDTRVRDSLAELAESGARIPERLAEALADPVHLDDEAGQRERFAEIGPWMVDAAEQRALLEYRTGE